MKGIIASQLLNCTSSYLPAAECTCEVPCTLPNVHSPLHTALPCPLVQRVQQQAQMPWLLQRPVPHIHKHA